MAAERDLARDLLDDGVGGALLALTTRQDILGDDVSTWRVVSALYHLSSHAPSHHEALVNAGAVRRIAAIVADHDGRGEDGLSSVAVRAGEQCAAAALCNLSFCKEPGTRAAMVGQGAVSALVSVAGRVGVVGVTQDWCAMAMANLSAHTDVGSGHVATLLRATLIRGDGAAQRPSDPAAFPDSRPSDRRAAVVQEHADAEHPRLAAGRSPPSRGPRGGRRRRG